MLIVAATAGCTDDDRSGAEGGPTPQPQQSTPASVAPEPVVARLDTPTGQARLGPIPQQFPTSLDGMPPYVPKRSHPALLVYRPYESPSDGSGWASEQIGIYSRDGEWARLDLSTLGIDESLWPGVDTIGPGALDSGGRWLALSASDGVVVVDLLTGEVQNLLGSSGPVAGVRWHPSSTRLTANVLNGRDMTVDVPSGVAEPSPVPMLNLGFLPDGRVCSVRQTPDGASLREYGDGGALLSTRSLGFKYPGGELIRAWSAGSQLAFVSLDNGNRGVEMPSFDLVAGEVTGVLRWSARAGVWVEVEGWWDENRLLVSMDRWLVAWNPSDGSVQQVARLPRSDRQGRHGSVGVAFAL